MPMAYLVLEAKRSDGSHYRLSLGWVTPIPLASMVALLTRLF
jgi:hypothetical protein